MVSAGVRWPLCCSGVWAAAFAQLPSGCGDSQILADPRPAPANLGSTLRRRGASTRTGRRVIAYRPGLRRERPTASRAAIPCSRIGSHAKVLRRSILMEWGPVGAKWRDRTQCRSLQPTVKVPERAAAARSTLRRPSPRRVPGNWPAFGCRRPWSPKRSGNLPTPDYCRYRQL